MARQFLYFLVLQLLLLTMVFAWSGQTTSTRSRGKKKTKEVKEVNICNIEGQDAPIFCYCDNRGLRNATNADCWVLSSFNRSDPVWGYFTSQVYLEKLMFTVRQVNSLDHVPTRLLHQLTNLRTVAFQYATFHELSEHTFSNLSGLSEINLCRNKIVTLRKYAFENMRNLTTINLSENRINEINRDTFVNLPALRNLYLTHNNITILHDKAFKHLGSLHELELNGNEITVVTRDSFHGLRSLRRLDLRNNFISMIGERTFAEMPELVELELDQNEIEYISERALDGMRNLRKLRLSENRLVKLEPDFLVGAHGINFLDLRNNALKTMTFDNIKPIVTNLYSNNSFFFLGNNKLICDCKLTWIWGLRNETKSIKLRDALEELTCLLESNNATVKINDEDAERNQVPEIARNPEEYPADNSRGNDGNEDDVTDKSEDYYELDENVPLNSNSYGKVNGEGARVCCMKHLFDLKPEELPCPEYSREDLMASEQPSSRHENARVGSSGSIWFGSSAKTVRPGQSVLAASLLPLLFILFT